MSKYTKEDYLAVAPFVEGIGDFSATAIESKLDDIPEAPEPTPIPDPTKANIVALFNAVYAEVSVSKAIENAGGIAKLGAQYGMTAEQCKTCIREFEAMRVLYNTNPIIE